jgi:hypothetical protein
MKKTYLALVAIVLAPFQAYCGSYLVIAYSDQQNVTTVIRQKADYVTMSLSISSDQKDPVQRYAEIRNVKQLIEEKSKANSDVIVRAGAVSLSARPVSKMSSFSSYSDRSSEADLNIFVSMKDKSRDIYTCATIIRNFLDQIKLPSKAELRLGSMKLAVDNPEQYRSTILEKIGEEVRNTRDHLKSSGDVELGGLEGPVLVRQLDDENVELFIDYKFSIELESVEQVGGANLG